MAQLQIPLSIWLASSPQERDQFYLDAGFDPNLPVVDNGTDTQTVRFRQDSLMVAAPSPVLAANAGPQAGDDLRDYTPDLLSLTSNIRDEFGVPQAPTGDPSLPVIYSAGALASRLPGVIRPQYLTWLASQVGGARLAFAALPWWLRQALQGMGITAGVIAVDAGLEAGGLPSLPGDLPFVGPPQAPDIQIGPPSPMQGVQVVGTWVANGVKFYRLADGKLAVQNKRGRWKVWRPKRPIVLYADGASNLKTMLRADKALTKQAKKIAAMLNRRAPRPRKAAGRPPTGAIIVNEKGQVVTV